MKKLLLLSALPLLLIAASCPIPGGGTCNRAFTNAGMTIISGARYLIIYPGIPAFISDRIGRSDGTVSFPAAGHPCGSITVTAVTNSNLALSASPSSVYLPSPPTTATITGQSFSTTYDMPQVEYFDSNGYRVGSVQATSVTSGGTSLQANMPDLSYVYSGTYQVRVTNKTSEGYYAHIVGTAPMTGWGRERPDTDGDGWYDDEDCAPNDPFLNHSCQTCGGYDPNTGFYAPETICQY